MKIDIRQDGPVSILDLHGRLVIGPSEDALRDAIIRLLAEGHRQYLLNMRGVPYVDSAGIGQLAACKKRVIENDGALKIEWVRGRYHLAVETVIQLMFPDAHFEEEKAALSSFSFDAAPPPATRGGNR